MSNAFPILVLYLNLLWIRNDAIGGHKVLHGRYFLVRHWVGTFY